MATSPEALHPLPEGLNPALNCEQASQYTGLAVKTLEKMRCDGRGPRFVRFSRNAVRYLKVDLDTWLAALTVSSTSEKAAA